MRYAAKVDANQQAIIETLRQIGASVQPLHNVGQGCPDLMVGYRGINYLMEIKANDGKTLTPDQLVWHGDWRGTVFVVHSVDEALQTIGAIGPAPKARHLCCHYNCNRPASLVVEEQPCCATHDGQLLAKGECHQ